MPQDDKRLHDRIDRAVKKEDAEQQRRVSEKLDRKRQFQRKRRVP